MNYKKDTLLCIDPIPEPEYTPINNNNDNDDQQKRLKYLNYLPKLSWVTEN